VVDSNEATCVNEGEFFFPYDASINFNSVNDVNVVGPMCYGWEDNGLALEGETSFNFVGDLTNIVSPAGNPNPGTRALQITGSRSGTNSNFQIFLGGATDLNDGDIVAASFYAYDTTPGENPSNRIWGHYSSFFPGFNGSAGGNNTFSGGTVEAPSEWTQLEHVWVQDEGDTTMFDPRTALVVQARSFGAPLEVDVLEGTAQPETYVLDQVCVVAISTGSSAAIVLPEGDGNVDPTGACCVDEVCTDTVVVANCAGNAFQDMLCSEVTCPTTGGEGPDFSVTACCLSNSSCFDNPSTQQICTNSNGTFFRGVTCAELDCENVGAVGACCNGTECAVDVPASVCVGAGVTFSADGSCEDLDNNTIADLCETAVVCDGDANGDNVVNVADFIAVLLNFGQTGSGLAGDANSDDVVNVADFIAVLLNFGTSCS
ncbi:MAG: hypothetical protein AAGB34_08035, partial [Planctomycetota bacterium]